MSYSKNKSKYTKLPFEISKANGINDNFTIQFKPKSATMFRASDEYTKFIDDDYSKFLHASVINGNAAATFNLKAAKTQTSQVGAQTEAVRTSQAEVQTDAQSTPPFFNVSENVVPDLEPVLIGRQNTEESRAQRMREMGQNISILSGDDMLVNLMPSPTEVGASSTIQPGASASSTIQPSASSTIQPSTEEVIENKKGAPAALIDIINKIDGLLQNNSITDDSDRAFIENIRANDFEMYKTVTRRGAKKEFLDRLKNIYKTFKTTSYVQTPQKQWVKKERRPLSPTGRLP